MSFGVTSAFFGKCMKDFKLVVRVISCIIQVVQTERRFLKIIGDNGSYLFIFPSQNTPNDLQLLSDAPAHRIFCLLGPVDPAQNTLPEVYCVLQVKTVPNIAHTIGCHNCLRVRWQKGQKQLITKLQSSSIHNKHVLLSVPNEVKQYWLMKYEKRYESKNYMSTCWVHVYFFQVGVMPLHYLKLFVWSLVCFKNTELPNIHWFPGNQTKALCYIFCVTVLL